MYSAQPMTIDQRAVSIVHEMIQPLTAMLTNAETAVLWLTRDPPNLDEAKQAVERIIGNSRRAADVVRNVRDLARKSLPLTADLDINEMIKDVLNLMSLDLRQHGVAVETELAENLKPISSDRVQLQRVVANLITNGIEAMSAVADRQRKLRISTQLDKNGDVLVAVEDSGKGLDESDIDRIFDPFFSTKRDGLGLGLSICRSIVEAHGGRLSAMPNLPHGSIFSFVIPNIVEASRC
jgi:signal transduction histidine kinase